MNIPVVLLFVAVFGHSVLAQKCCMPVKWEGRENITVGSIGIVNPSGAPTLSRSSMKISFDATKRISNANGVAVFSGTKHPFRIIQDFAKNVMYTILDKECSKTPPNFPWFVNCLACRESRIKTDDIVLESGDKEIIDYRSKNTTIDNATLVSKGYIGLQNKKNIRVYEMKAQGFNVSVSVDENCIVIDKVIYNDYVLMAVRLSDITQGIKNETVFDIPDICKRRTMHLRHPFEKTLHRRIARSIFHGRLP